MNSKTGLTDEAHAVINPLAGTFSDSEQPQPLAEQIGYFPKKCSHFVATFSRPLENVKERIGIKGQDKASVSGQQKRPNANWFPLETKALDPAVSKNTHSCYKSGWSAIESQESAQSFTAADPSLNERLWKFRLDDGISQG